MLYIKFYENRRINKKLKNRGGGAWEGVGGNMLCDWARVHRGDMIDGTDNDRVKL